MSEKREYYLYAFFPMPGQRRPKVARSFERDLCGHTFVFDFAADGTFLGVEVLKNRPKPRRPRKARKENDERRGNC